MNRIAAKAAFAAAIMLILGGAGFLVEVFAQSAAPTPSLKLRLGDSGEASGVSRFITITPWGEGDLWAVNKAGEEGMDHIRITLAPANPLNEADLALFPNQDGVAEWYDTIYEQATLDQGAVVVHLRAVAAMAHFRVEAVPGGLRLAFGTLNLVGYPNVVQQLQQKLEQALRLAESANRNNLELLTINKELKGINRQVFEHAIALEEQVRGLGHQPVALNGLPGGQPETVKTTAASVAGNLRQQTGRVRLLESNSREPIPLKPATASAADGGSVVIPRISVLGNGADEAPPVAPANRSRGSRRPTASNTGGS